MCAIPVTLDIRIPAAMSLERLLKFLLYLGYLVGALWFSKKAINEYMEGTTGYSVTQEPITLQDMPTLTTCFVWTRSTPEGTCKISLSNTPKKPIISHGNLD